MYIIKVYGELNTWKGHLGNVARRKDAKRFKNEDEAWLFCEEKNYPEYYEIRKPTRRTTKEFSDPWAELGSAIVGQAQKDLRNLTLYGVIKEMEVIDVWPEWEGKRAKVSHHYRTKQEAEELVEFFTDGWCGRLMRAFGSDVCGDSVSRQIIKEKGCVS